MNESRITLLSDFESSWYLDIFSITFTTKISRFMRFETIAFVCLGCCKCTTWWVNPKGLTCGDQRRRKDSLFHLTWSFWPHGQDERLRLILNDSKFISKFETVLPQTRLRSNWTFDWNCVTSSDRTTPRTGGRFATPLRLCSQANTDLSRFLYEQ
jgi:hypothetical protein